MTDQNRGAYTPQSDAPLSFDARRAGGARGPMPITLIFSALILLVLVIGGGVAVLYHNGQRKPGEPPQPVGEAVGSMKAAPEVQAPPQVAVAPAPAPGAAPTFTAPPEQPAARPIEVAPLPPPAAAAKAEPAPTATKTETPAPVAQAKAEPAPKALSVTAPAKTVPPPAKAAVAAAPAPKAAASGALVQIGAYSSSALASNGWNEVAKLMPGEMAGKTKDVEPVERDGKTLYRARIGGFASHADAERLCLALLSKGRDCKVV